LSELKRVDELCLRKPDFSQELDEAALEAQRQQKVQHLVQHAVVESIQFISTKAF